jgi:ABC-2 type transport system ATP-binding protein
MEAISVKNLVKKYNHRTVLDDLDLTIQEGQFYCLMGPNGSGKTTLTSIIASIIKPSSGEVRIYGKKPSDARNILGFIPQENFSDPNLTGIENLFYFSRLLGFKKIDSKKMAEKLLDKVGLSEDKNKRVSMYSGGMRKKLELATILFPEIKLLILDEPTTGLDPSARRIFFGLVDEIKDKKTTVLLVSHIGSDAEMATRVGLINEGKIVSEGSPEQLKKSSGLKNVINIEASVKNEKIKNILNSFNRGEELMETEEGYRIYSEKASEVIPDVVRAVEMEGYNVVQIGSVTPSLEDVFYIVTGTKCSNSND